MDNPRAGASLTLQVIVRSPFPASLGDFPIVLECGFETWNLPQEGGLVAQRFEPRNNPTKFPHFQDSSFILPVTLEYIFMGENEFLASQSGYPICYGGILGDGKPFLYRWDATNTNRTADLKGLRRMLVEGRVSNFGLEFSKIKTRPGFFLRSAIGS